jgi:aspartyl-tRNA(Asn)/glutamyl-tRNA(Gln) amidotransferase subunit A
VTDKIDWITAEQGVLYLCSIAHNLGPYLAEWGHKMDPVLRAYIAAGEKFVIGDYIKAINARTRLFRAIQGLFERYDYILSPTLTRTAINADFNSAGGIVEIDGVAVGRLQPHWTGYMYPFNITGHPALSVPSGFGVDGLPTGVQIVGPRHSDANVLRLGAVLEEARPWADRKPTLALA